MKTSEPAYLIRRIADTWIAADETFSQFYELEHAEELEPRCPPELPGVESAQAPFFCTDPFPVMRFLAWRSWAFPTLAGQAFVTPPWENLYMPCGKNHGKRSFILR